MPNYVPIQDLPILTDLSDTDYIPVSDGETAFAIQVEDFKAYDVDPTLTMSGYAADAKVTGDSVNELKDATGLLDQIFAVNLFPKSGYTNGKYINYSTGNEGTNASYFHTSYIPVASGRTYFFKGYTGNGQLAYYNANKTFTPGVVISAGSTVTIPTGVEYIIGSFPLSALNTIGMYCGADTTLKEGQKQDSFYAYMLNYLALHMTATIVLPSNYTSILPDLDNADENSLYYIAYSQFTISGLPAHTPYGICVEPALLLTANTTEGSIYKTQLWITKTGILTRFYASGAGWQPWTVIKKQDIHVTAGVYLIRLVESQLPCNIHLDTDVDLFDSYATEKGSDYWKEYRGYTDGTTTVRNKAGMFIYPHVNFNGNGHTVSFKIPPEVLTDPEYSTAIFYIKRDISPFNLGGDNVLENVIIDIGNDNCRYAIHDDFAYTTEGEIIRNVTMKGTGHSPALLGAGVKPYCNYIIENCICLDNQDDCDILYHSSTRTTQAASYLVIRNCYCEKDINIKYVGTNQVVTPCIVTGNKVREITLTAGQESAQYQNMQLIAWNNELTGS